MALKTDVPISAVFFGDMPDTFLGRPVVNGDNSDIENLAHRRAIIGLKYKPPRGAKRVNVDDQIFVINTSKLGVAQNEK